MTTSTVGKESKVRPIAEPEEGSKRVRRYGNTRSNIDVLLEAVEVVMSDYESTASSSSSATSSAAVAQVQLTPIAALQRNSRSTRSGSLQYKVQEAAILRVSDAHFDRV